MKKYLFRNHWDCRSPDEIVNESGLTEYHKKILNDPKSNIFKEGNLIRVHYRIEDVCY